MKLVINALLLVMFAIPIALSQDTKNASDHPLIGRFKGSEIIGYKVAEYDEYEIALGPQTKKGDEIAFTKSINVEGKVTRILYLTPRGTSTLQAIKSYERELKRKGFKSLFYCASPQCGWVFVHTKPFYNKALYPHIWSGIKEHRYLSAKATKGNKNIYVAVFAFEHSFPLNKFKGRVLVQLDIVEEEALEENLIVSSEYIEQQIKQQGFVSIYSIYFDHNSDKIKPGSASTLSEIAKFLKDNPDIKLFIVGHTDNTGSYKYNLDLSLRRAKAVVNKLVSDYGISQDRLKPVGVGPVAPKASNQTEEGRAKNRRVELVEM